MSGDRSATDDPTADLRPGPLAWATIVVGWVVMIVAVVGVTGDLERDELGSWSRWVVGSALVHDLVVLPLVLGAGWLLTRLAPVPWRVPLRTAAVVAAVVSLTVWPIAQRWGARDDNPSIMPLPVARNLALIVVALFACALVAGAVAQWRQAAPREERRSEPEESTT